MGAERFELPLRTRTPSAWATQVLRDPLALLCDHAHLEKKAAGNALDLLNRWPDPSPPAGWIRRLAAIARDEVEHLGIVTKLIERRGGQMTRLHRNPYANALHRLVRRGEGPLDTLDRLLVSALIEGRSCERFTVLAEHCPDEELANIYRGLLASERGHFLTFRELADFVLPDPSAVTHRWQELLDAEAELISGQPASPRILGGAERS